MTPVRDGRVASDEIRVRIGPAVGDYPGRVTERTWVVRLHLPPGRGAREVVSGEGDAEPSQPAVWRRIEPAPAPAAREPPPMPLLGAGSPPPFRAGPVIEAELPAGPASVPRQVVFRLQ